MEVEPIRVLFVCLGNICRSPLAEAVFRRTVADAGLTDRFEIDSAGTSGYHDGEPPDGRAAETAARRGVTLSGASRRITAEDVAHHDYLIVMDRENLAEVEELVADADADPDVHLLREFDELAAGDLEVPDPYFGGPQGFDLVHDLVERSCAGLLAHIREEHGL